MHLGIDLASQLKTKEHLNFIALRKSIAAHFAAIPDSRQQGKVATVNMTY